MVNDCQGLVDLDLEISKCEKKLDLARLNLQKIVKVESQPDYTETVPENVRVANDDKVCCFLSFAVFDSRITVPPRKRR